MATGSVSPFRSAQLGDQRELAVALINAVWELLELDDRTVDGDERMLHMVHAARYHWGQAGDPVNLVRAEWCSRVYAVLGRAEPYLYHARRMLVLCQRHGVGDFDLGYAYEALARAYAVAGDVVAARSHTELALVAADDVAELAGPGVLVVATVRCKLPDPTSVLGSLRPDGILILATLCYALGGVYAGTRLCPMPIRWLPV